VATAVGGIGLVRSSGSGFDPVVGGQLRSPPVLASSGGVLATLEAARSQLPVAGQVVTALGDNGALPGPTLRVHPRDLVRVSPVNRLDVPTNLHVHGLTVSPEENGTTCSAGWPRGEAGQYEYRLPMGHPPGVFWYHPHVHGAVTDQVFRCGDKVCHHVVSVASRIWCASRTPPLVCRGQAMASKCSRSPRAWETLTTVARLGLPSLERAL
jgi:hypothetical protein